MDQDWSAVGRAMTNRLQELGMTMTDLANRSGVSLTTVRELVQTLNVRNRNPRTLSSLSRHLDWPEDHLVKVLHGRAEKSPERRDTRTDRLDELEQVVAELQERVAALERAALNS